MSQNFNTCHQILLATKLQPQHIFFKKKFMSSKFLFLLQSSSFIFPIENIIKGKKQKQKMEIKNGLLSSFSSSSPTFNLHLRWSVIKARNDNIPTHLYLDLLCLPLKHAKRKKIYNFEKHILNLLRFPVKKGKKERKKIDDI